MVCRGSLFASGFFGHVLCGLLTVFLIILILVGELFLAVVIIGIAAGIIIRLQTRKLSFEDDKIHYDGWFKTIIVSIPDIFKVETSEELGYPHNRLHGPLEYRVITNKGEVWISLLFFQTEAAIEFQKLYKRLKKQ